MSTTDNIVEIIQNFSEHYNNHDIPAMIELFMAKATIEYVPFALSGPVDQMRPDSWGILIDAFPDLQSEENLACPSADGRFVHIDVNIKGTQAKNAFGVDNKGRSYDVRHLFVFELNEKRNIINLTSF